MITAEKSQTDSLTLNVEFVSIEIVCLGTKRTTIVVSLDK